MSIYVCSDIHGQYELFMKMLDVIHFSDEDRLYILGDIIDRGPDSIRLLQEVIRMPNAIPLIGNHELMMYDHIHRNTDRDFWFLGGNGGKKTMSQFKRLSKEEQSEILEYIEEMYLQIEYKVGEQVFLFSHSSFLDERGTCKWKDVEIDTAFDAVWYSPWRIWEMRSERDYGKDGRVHIIGHVPTQSVRDHYKNYQNYDANKMQMPCAYVNRINNIVNIDTGCARMGKRGIDQKELALCCMDLQKYANKEDAFIYIQ